MSMYRAIVFIFLCVIETCSFASQNVEQGPFHLEGGGASIEFIRKNDESIDFIRKSSIKNELVDNYPVSDGVPEINTVFFVTIKKIKNIVVLVSWDEADISAIHYKVYLYTYNESGKININRDAMDDKNLEGYDGYSNSGMIFNYKNAAAIRKYLSQLK